MYYGEHKMANKILQVIASTPDGVEFEFTDESRWIIFEETAEKIDPTLAYAFSNAQAIKNKWIYAFGSTDGTTFTGVWEIKTDSTGNQFATYELTEDNYDTRSASLPMEDVAFIPEKDQSGKPYTVYACVSEIRIPSKRIFNPEDGILKNPTIRCSNIDDKKQVLRESFSTGEEKIVLLNTMLHAECLRKRVDDLYTDWESSRCASGLIDDKAKKKKKLVHEYGAILLLILDAIPDYKKHLAPGKYKDLYELIKAYDKETENITEDISRKVKLLCTFIATPVFVETCIDYNSTIVVGETQPDTFYHYENRLGNIIENICRFKEGANLIQSLLPHVTSKEKQTWLQNLLLLNNDLWDVESPQEISDHKTGMKGSKIYQNIRKVTDGFAKISIEAAKGGWGVYKPEQIIVMLTNTFKTTAMEFGFTFSKFSTASATPLRSFKQIFGSTDELSFWRINIDPPKDSAPNTKVAAFLRSPVFKKILLGLEGLALFYNIQELYDKQQSGKANTMDYVTFASKLAAYLAKCELIKLRYAGQWVKVGSAPLAIISTFTSGWDAFNAFQKGEKLAFAYDWDAATMSKISAFGYAAAAAGYGILAASFFAASAAADVTGVGVPPGLLLAVIGTTMATGASCMAQHLTNTALENIILTTPWGTNPANTVDSISIDELTKFYVKTLRILNSFKVNIDMISNSIVIHLNRIEPDTVITVHEIVYGIPRSSDGVSTETTSYKQLHVLNDSNCKIVKLQSGGVEVHVNLAQFTPDLKRFLDSCPYFKLVGATPRPDYMSISISIDLEGDTVIMLPDQNKKLFTEKYSTQRETSRIN
jgi:hypothetical protein